MQHFRSYFIAFLVVLVAAVPVRSAPAMDLNTCLEHTEELQTNSFSIIVQEGDLEDWKKEQKPNICVQQQSNKVTCNVDYVNATESSNWCLEVPDTIYFETTYILKCENDNNKNHVFYSVRNRPACYSTACFDGYDMEMLENLERATFEDLISEMKNPNTDSEWGDMGAFDECREMRLSLTDPIISEAVAVVTTANPTISPAPTSSTAPTNSPTVSPAPTISPAPTATPKELTCKEESASLVSGTGSIRLMGEDSNSGLSGVALGLNNIQDLMMIDTLTGKGFEEHCNAINETSALCDFDYRDAIATTKGTEISVDELCQDAYGVYVEDSVSITCTSEDSTSKTTLVFKNKPSCRSRLCNADDIREVATTEFDRWMKLTLEDGLDEASVASGESILSGPHSCVIDVDEDQDEEEGVEVAVGGTILSNIGGDPIQPTNECRVFTNNVDGNINIYNEKAIFQRDILDYVNTDLRQICGSPIPGQMECNFDWSEILALESSEDVSEDTSDAETRKADAAAFKDYCMPDGIGNSGAGQYIESTFQITCSNLLDNTITVTNTNVPGCVGRPCTPGQAEFLLANEYDYLADKFIKNGWDCSTEILSVYAPNYNPFFGAYSITDMANIQQVQPVLDEPEQDLVGSGDFEGDNTAVVKDVDIAPTPPPSEASNLHLRGPKYENLFKTDPPVPVQEVTLGAASPSPTRFSGTTTVLLLIPAAFSMLFL